VCGCWGGIGKREKTRPRGPTKPGGKKKNCLKKRANQELGNFRESGEKNPLLGGGEQTVPAVTKKHHMSGQDVEKVSVFEKIQAGYIRGGNTNEPRSGKESEIRGRGKNDRAQITQKLTTHDRAAGKWRFARQGGAAKKEPGTNSTNQRERTLKRDIKLREKREGSSQDKYSKKLDRGTQNYLARTLEG